MSENVREDLLVNVMDRQGEITSDKKQGAWLVYVQGLGVDHEKVEVNKKKVWFVCERQTDVVR